MCQVSRRELLAGAAAALGALEEETAWALKRGRAQVGAADQVAPDVYFHVGDLEGRGHCNNGWIVFEDFVLVVDANFPSGAREILPKIRAITQKPIRFAFDTHHHGDHAYGNQFWIENGAVPVAHAGVAEEMRKYEPQRWNETAQAREDVRESRLKPPSVLFPGELYFDDGKRRVELLHLGTAHTRGDAVAWLPKERILFTGDVCVNGPYNYVGDGDVQKWVRTLEAAKRLGARTVCPGHGPRATQSLLDEQQRFFRALQERVARLVRRRAHSEAVRAALPQIEGELKADPRIARYVGSGLAAQAEKVYREMTGRGFADDVSEAARRAHSRSHG